MMDTTFSDESDQFPDNPTGTSGRRDDDDPQAEPSPVDQAPDTLNSSQPPFDTQQNSSRWEETLNKIIPAIVSIRFIGVRNFDTEHQRASQATGFIVDKERGIILSNRHVVQPGPVLAEAILNQSKEEIKLTPIYRDPGELALIMLDRADLAAEVAKLQGLNEW
ncbi:serine protease [Quaeritorhiza haematococci]|nr:serine protease [Quaeritorhiza haematococci]